ncbi:MAG: sigma-54 dependent transcriptional regulator [Planctomycetota bacterium]
MTTASTVLIVDDKEMMRDSVGATLKRAGFEVRTADGGAAALDAIAAARPDAVVTDLKMPGMTGTDLIEKVRELDDELPVVMMTAFGTIDTAVEAIRLGAFDYITKPFEGDELVIAVKRAIQHGKLVRENAVLRAATAESASEPTAERIGLGRLIGESSAMRRVKQQAEAVAGSVGTVLICGESGTGKEVVARAIHEAGPRSDGPFLAINCAALSESLLESELFGHERGAFTGADRLRKGRFELAHGGTLLLDEVSEVSPAVQSKLLRVLQERAFERVGSSATISVDVRVIATSNRDLPQEVAKGTFRQDLFFRLNVLPIHMPPVREREGDVAKLSEHFAGLIAAREGRGPVAIDGRAMELLRSYAWPGNVRELQNIIERAVVLLQARSRNGGDGGVITPDLISPWLNATPTRAVAVSSVVEPKPAANGHAGVNGMHGMNGVNGTNGHHASSAANGFASGLPGAVPIGSVRDANGEIRPLEQIEREAIIAALRSFNGHRQRTAKALGIGVRTLGLKLKKWKEMQLVEPTL